MNDNFEYTSLKDIKSEEKRLYNEYKKRMAELKKAKKEKIKATSSGQVFTKGLLPIYVLHILNLNPTNGNEIAHKISQRTDDKWRPSTGGIYPILKKLESEGLIVGEWDDPKKKFKKIYSITEEGHKDYLRKKALLKPKIEEALDVFNLIYNDIY
ncbi:PadR family transcriptional regulator [Clostridium thermobutyricum]|uniref:Lineage-specific thermal regulator protein n=1 Tax=Clostridium thermobutyricum DSM 4928 TaxID=1121339 RepID=A0A1V4ST73_9CLOT|nr:PadR family transcriptional regulator [Clostridium thermobutyricum]OPX47069.1 lineage-specific thermal regulator protein [Clostridium thermobutyricum DSM 4928]